MHLKRIASPKKWPVKRKGTKYLISNKGGKNSIPLVIVFRDLLKIARTSKEVKKSLRERNILINGKVIYEKDHPLTLFDIITIKPMNKSYKIILNNKGKFSIEEVSDKESGEKVVKIINKKLLKGKKIQINLSDGRNYLSTVECKVGDSVVINFNKNSIEKCVPFQEHHKGLILTGKNVGELGKIIKIDHEKKKIKFLLEKGDKEIELQAQSILVLP